MREKPSAPAMSWRHSGRIAGVSQVRPDPPPNSTLTSMQASARQPLWGQSTHGRCFGRAAGAPYPDALCAAVLHCLHMLLQLRTGHFVCLSSAFHIKKKQLISLSTSFVLQVNDHTLVTAAADGRLMVWDLRQSSTPLKFSVPDGK